MSRLSLQVQEALKSPLHSLRPVLFNLRACLTPDALDGVGFDTLPIDRDKLLRVSNEISDALSHVRSYRYEAAFFLPYLPSVLHRLWFCGNLSGSNALDCICHLQVFFVHVAVVRSDFE